jgi:hypothetical protein
MVHCGFEGTAATDAVKHPWKNIPLMMRGVKTDGPMAPEVDMTHQRPAEYLFSEQVEKQMSQMRARKADPKKIAAAE